tara:strand:- start:142 stop:657 length:516 start_codon:yes stop_codon:yes gene_type:complete
MSVSNSQKHASMKYKLYDKWNLYYHLPDNKNWDLSSYTILLNHINSVEEVIALNDKIGNKIITNTMLFLMRDGITPRWEDTKNRNGGCFSFKVSNKNADQVWKSLFYLTCGENLLKSQNELVNGITISPKKNFCIVKIWMSNTTVQDPNIIVPVDNISIQGCLFKKHEPEF